jgi:hypothetical protein
VAKAKVVSDYAVVLAAGRFELRVKIFKVEKTSKFPDGYKVSCVMLDTELSVARLVLDNHEPFGYHLHTKLPGDKNFRLSISVESYKDAVRAFFKQARRIANEK